MHGFLITFLMSILLMHSTASAQETKKPKILFLGDPIQQTIVQAAAVELGSIASIHYPAEVTVNDSATALEKFDSLLGTTQWDIIYFNFGIGELFYKDPSTREIRIMSKDSGGVRVSTPEQYEKQLDSLVQRLRKTKAKLVWGNTTPMINVHRYSTNRGIRFDANSELEYNSIAARVMAKHKVPVVDLHGHVMVQFKLGDNHPAYTNYTGEMTKRGHPIHVPLVQALKEAASNIR
jgi:hypothetical protein